MESIITPNAVEIIQLALAPIFLIVGIGTLVNVATGRVARVIDRARWFEDLAREQPARIDRRAKHEIRTLNKRMRLANWSINFLIASALVICFDVILLMVNGLISTSLDTAVLVTFMISILFLTGGLIAFFFEVSLATASLKISATKFRQINDSQQLTK
ncbi:DUF2721 domain-containing protein [Brumicola nitratireducens]|uniref:DUF2721 domain-containing protein n=1 Tax=Glaciecola nitratireducens (strain JCM 12485 / KCTC 12276 / FR1064) TaxID=1085623 RepID=G4QER4_GLANF|nr:DUF2721 domain-containing protein [Glaciecola nitratireducens]AEP29603.1 hypothetical protein GNIT_1485 [Glaciecola nitratireducens FR1064]